MPQSKPNMQMDAREVGRWFSCARREATRWRGREVSPITGVGAASAIRAAAVATEGRIELAERSVIFDDATQGMAALHRAGRSAHMRFAAWLEERGLKARAENISMTAIVNIRGGDLPWRVQYSGKAETMLAGRDGSTHIADVSCSDREPVDRITRLAVLCWLWKAEGRDADIKPEFGTFAWIPRDHGRAVNWTMRPFVELVELGWSFASMAGRDARTKQMRPGRQCVGCFNRQCPAFLPRFKHGE